MFGFESSADFENNQAHCWIDIDERHLNSFGIVHGAVHTAILDVALALAVSVNVGRTDQHLTNTVSLNTNYVGAARAGRITATGRFTGGGRSILFAEGEVRDETGTIVSTATGIFKRVKK
ncbi:PaaI family thioesterase [Flexibacterium corallicola]|uniref:PaaI family thioesterase n=1 Tax=Flexibacterium corallicola TaxID=3037259 RepID=UPI00286EED04|nr:PaaI family thioesterase [Pseudovibrio sp. M1P-2-3]